MKPRSYWLIILALLTTLTGQCAGTEHAHAAAAGPPITAHLRDASEWSS